MKYGTPIKSLVILIFVALLFGCSKSKTNPTPQPTTALAVTSLSVSSGPYNTNVVITGTGFDATLTNDKVFFNGVAGTITAATTTQLTASVPIGAGTGPVTVSVKNSTPATGPVFNYQYTYMASVFTGDDQPGEVNGTGKAAAFNSPLSIAIDTGNNLFVAGNDPLIREISPKGVVTSYAGLSLSPANNGRITAQQLNLPHTVAIDKNENLYFVDQQTGAVWKISPQGTVSVAVDVLNPQGLTTDNAGNLYIADTFANQVKEMTPQGVVTILAGNGQPGYENGTGTSAYFNSPSSLAIDKEGNIYVTDYYNSGTGQIRKITPNGTVTDFTSPVFINPIGLAIDSSGNLYVADSGSNLISKVTPSGIVSNFAGGGYLNGLATGLEFQDLHAIAIDSHDNIYVAAANDIYKIANQ